MGSQFFSSKSHSIKANLSEFLFFFKKGFYSFCLWKLFGWRFILKIKKKNSILFGSDCKSPIFWKIRKDSFILFVLRPSHFWSFQVFSLHIFWRAMEKNFHEKNLQHYSCKQAIKFNSNSSAKWSKQQIFTISFPFLNHFYKKSLLLFLQIFQVFP